MESIEDGLDVFLRQFRLFPWTMNRITFSVISLQAFCLFGAIVGQIDQVCHEYCQSLVVQGGVVKFLDPAPHAPRTLAIGEYFNADEGLVPRTEAPIRDLREIDGWRVVMSAFLDHDELDVKLRLRFFDDAGVLRTTEDVLSRADDIQIGRLFGGKDAIFAISSEEQHAYNVQAEIWLLPDMGDPKRLLWIQGGFRSFQRGVAGKQPGVTIDRQTYDGVDSTTKGTVREFYVWDPKTKSLGLSKR